MFVESRIQPGISNICPGTAVQIMADIITGILLHVGVLPDVGTDGISPVIPLGNALFCGDFANEPLFAVKEEKGGTVVVTAVVFISVGYSHSIVADGLGERS